MIYIQADFSKIEENKFLVQKDMSKDDYVIIYSDFGGIWNYIV